MSSSTGVPAFNNTWGALGLHQGPAQSSAHQGGARGESSSGRTVEERKPPGMRAGWGESVLFVQGGRAVCRMGLLGTRGQQAHVPEGGAERQGAGLRAVGAEELTHCCVGRGGTRSD